MTDEPRQPRSAAKRSAELYLEDLFVGQHFTSGTYDGGRPDQGVRSGI